MGQLLNKILSGSVGYGSGSSSNNVSSGRLVDRLIADPNYAVKLYDERRKRQEQEEKHLEIVSKISDILEGKTVATPREIIRLRRDARRIGIDQNTQSAINRVFRKMTEDYRKKIQNLEAAADPLNQQFTQLGAGGFATAKPVSVEEKKPSIYSRIKDKLQSFAPKTIGDAIKKSFDPTGIGRAIAQGVARSGAKIVSTFAEPFVGKENVTYKPEGIAKYILGEKRIKPLTTIAEEQMQKAEPYGKLAQGGAALLPVALVAGDIIPSFEGTKNLSKEIVEATTPKAASKVAKKLGIEAADNIIKKIINVKNIDEAKKIISEVNAAKTSIIDVSKDIAKSRNAEEIENLLRKVGVSEDNILKYTKKLQTIDNPQVVYKGLQKIANVFVYPQSTIRPLAGTDKTASVLENIPRLEKQVLTDKDILKSPSYKENSVLSQLKQSNDYKSILEADKTLNPGEINPNKVSIFKKAQKAIFGEWWTKTRERIQDNWIRVKKLQREPGVKVSKDLNPYDAEILFHGRVSRRLELAKEAVEEVDKDILKTAKSLGVKDKELYEDVNKYLIATHAPERNARLGVKAAGMTNEEASKILSEIENKKHAKEIKRIADKIKEIHSNTLDILRDSQIISDDFYNTLKKTYKNHVPLNRIFEETEDVGQVLAPKGFSIKGTGIRRAKGSEREVADIMTNVTANLEQAIVRAEKNRVNLAILKFARENPQLGIFEEIKPPSVPVAKVTYNEVIDEEFFKKVISFAKSLGAKVTTKGQPGRTLGYFEPSSKVVRRIGTPREVLSHEIGHFFDHKFGIKQHFYKRGASKQIAEEIIDWMDKIGEPASRKKVASERFADAFEWWLTNRALAEEELPLFSKKIEEIIKNQIPELKPLLDIRPTGKFSVRGIKELVFRPDPDIVMRDPLVLTIREKGKPVYLKIKDEKLAKVFQGIGNDKLPGVFKFIGSFTRLYAGLATRFNPEFVLSNKLRDIQEMAVYLAAQKKVGFSGVGKTVGRDAKSMWEVLNNSKLYQQMQLDGGTTGGMALSTRKNLEMSIEKIKRLNRSNPKKAAQYILEKIDKWNKIFEDSTRLSVYKTALDRGMSRNQAAKLAKEATVNFNKKGTGGQIINSLYMFSNASIQGTAKMFRAMKNPKVAAATVISVAAPVFAVNKWNDSIDENWRDKVDKWDRENNLIVMFKSDAGVKYFKIPVSWGLKPIKVAADYASDIYAGKNKGGILGATKGIIASALDAYNPAGGTDIPSALTPTILDMPSEIWRNKKWTGATIRPEDKQGVPRSEQFFKNKEGVPSDKSKTFGLFRNVTAWFSKKSKGEIEISPADVKYAYDQLIGGTGRTISKTIETVASVAKGELPQPKDVPFVSRFLTSKTEEELQKTDTRNERTVLFDRLRKASPEDRKKMMQEYLAGLPNDEERKKMHYIFQQEGLDTKGVYVSGDIIKIKPIYDRVQELVKQGKESEAQRIVDNLSDADYEAYKKAKAADQKRKAEERKPAMEELVLKIQELVRQGKEKEAQEIVDNLSDDDYRLYKLTKKRLGFE